TDENGNQLSNGIYFYKLTNGNESITRKMLLLH
ncbi:MAG: T9SS type A sorting domain-containing protein, partial [Candidatus Cloacimonetes bacterium]|nr:T9SS type A sorting domain-containing protein [Candidatus Cloacimonadota bacterium]